jgi:hypothetical protein
VYRTRAFGHKNGDMIRRRPHQNSGSLEVSKWPRVGRCDQPYDRVRERIAPRVPEAPGVFSRSFVRGRRLRSDDRSSTSRRTEIKTWSTQPPAIPDDYALRRRPTSATRGGDGGIRIPPVLLGKLDVFRTLPTFVPTTLESSECRCGRDPARLPRDLPCKVTGRIGRRASTRECRSHPRRLRA